MDKFRNLKFIGYCMAKIPSEEFDVRFTYTDFINYCKFQLCLVNHKLMKDPIWEDYDDEEILAEYYAHAISKDAEFAKTVEISIRGQDPDVYKWLDEMVEKNNKEMEEKAKELGEDEFEFSPESLGE